MSDYDEYYEGVGPCGLVWHKHFGCCDGYNAHEVDVLFADLQKLARIGKLTVDMAVAQYGGFDHLAEAAQEELARDIDDYLDIQR